MAFCVVLLVCVSSRSLAQADGRMHQYMFNQLDFNPAFAGSQGLINVFAQARQQWVGFGKGAPQTIFANFDIPFSYRKISQLRPGQKMHYSHGLGLHLVRDALGFSALNAVELSYSGRFHMRALGSLAVGVGFRAVNSRFEAEWVTVDNAENDPAIPPPKASTVGFDLSFGLYYNTDRMYFGVSGQNLLGPEVRNALSSKMGKRAHLNYARQYYLLGGYIVPVSSRWELEPSVLIRSDLVQHIFAFTATAEYNNLFWFGVTYHVMESVGALLGINLFNGLRIGYCYDYPTTAIRHFTSGSHEVLLGYSFGLEREKMPQQYKSIRFL